MNQFIKTLWGKNANNLPITSINDQRQWRWHKKTENPKHVNKSSSFCTQLPAPLAGVEQYGPGISNRNLINSMQSTPSLEVTLIIINCRSSFCNGTAHVDHCCRSSCHSLVQFNKVNCRMYKAHDDVRCTKHTTMLEQLCQKSAWNIQNHRDKWTAEPTCHQVRFENAECWRANMMF